MELHDYSGKEKGLLIIPKRYLKGTFSDFFLDSFVRID